MQAIYEFLRFAFEHLDVLAAAAIPALALLKLTAWGRANAEALDAIVRAIEKSGATEVKAAVADSEGHLTDVARDVLRDAVATADEKKPTPSLRARVAREAWRGILPVK